MFTPLTAAIFGISSVVTFFCYQSIPYNVRNVNEATPLVKSDVFTLFVRVCGMDHLVMAGGMLGVWAGAFTSHHAVGWVVSISALFVALISSMSAYVIHKAAK